MVSTASTRFNSHVDVKEFNSSMNTYNI